MKSDFEDKRNRSFIFFGLKVYYTPMLSSRVTGFLKLVQQNWPP